MVSVKFLFVMSFVPSEYFKCAASDDVSQELKPKQDRNLKFELPLSEKLEHSWRS